MENLTRYLSAIAQGHVMLDRRLITLHEYLAYEKRLAQKYRIPENSTPTWSFVSFIPILLISLFPSIFFKASRVKYCGRVFIMV